MSDATMQTHFVPELAADEKAYAGLAHALMMSTWWVGPLIIYFAKKDSRFVRFHAMQALLWQIIFSALHFLVFGAFFAVVMTSIIASEGKPPNPNQFPAVIFLTMPFIWLVVMGGFAITMTLGIMFSLRAMRGQWAGYPVIGNWAMRIAGS